MKGLGIKLKIGSFQEHSFKQKKKRLELTFWIAMASRLRFAWVLLRTGMSV